MGLMDRLQKVFRIGTGAAEAGAPPSSAPTPVELLFETYRETRKRLLEAHARGNSFEPQLKEQEASAAAALRAFCEARGDDMSDLDRAITDIDEAWHVMNLARAREASMLFAYYEFLGHEQPPVKELEVAEGRAQAELQEFCLTTGRSFETLLSAANKEMQEALSWLGK